MSLTDMNELHLSRQRKPPGSACSSEDHNRSTVKRLFSSVFSILDNDHQISRFEEDSQPQRIARLLEDPAFLASLQLKLQEVGLYQPYKLPVLRLSLPPAPHTHQLDETDLRGVATSCGQSKGVILTRDRKEAYLLFSEMANAFVCFQLLRRVTLRAGSYPSNVDWIHNSGCHPEVTAQIQNFVAGLSGQGRRGERQPEQAAAYGMKQNKLTCRYDIQIDNERQFQVARRIIGPKGCNMKRIIEESVPSTLKSTDSLNELLKLRLRGKGSGYKEGPEQQESSETLHLCVSAKDETVYSQACLKVEKLLSSIYLEYGEFTRRQGRWIELEIKKVSLGQSSIPSEESLNSGKADFQKLLDTNEEEVYRITPGKISELLELRNKARRQLNFQEADRIRNYLRSLGVCLIDEKGRRGRANEVTTWKYIY